MKAYSEYLRNEIATAAERIAARIKPSGSTPSQAAAHVLSEKLPGIRDQPDHRNALVAAPSDLSKRAMDIAVAVPTLILTSPLMAAIAVGIALTMGRPVMFRHRRPGKHERPFDLLKFRTMIDARGLDGELLPDRERLTGLGRFLRKTSLDELPELLNVLKGDMSLVGPRPLHIRYLPYYTDRERLRHSVLPGITGWAQINGRNEVSWDERLEYDVWYVEHQSIWLDLRILLATALLVVRGEGVVIDARSKMLNLDEERRGRERVS